MRKLILHLSTIGLAISLGTAFAADPYALPKDKEPQLGDNTKLVNQPCQHVRMSKIIGAKVKSAQGEVLGNVEDVIVDPDNGQIRLAILGIGGFLGVGEKKTAIPWQSVGFTSEKSLVVLMDREKLLGAPTVDLKSDDWSSPEFASRVFAYFGIDETAIGGTGTDVGVQRGKDLKDDLKTKGEELNNNLDNEKDRIIKDGYDKP